MDTVQVLLDAILECRGALAENQQKCVFTGWSMLFDMFPVRWCQVFLAVLRQVQDVCQGLLHGIESSVCHVGALCTHRAGFLLSHFKHIGRRRSRFAWQCKDRICTAQDVFAAPTHF